MAAIRELPSDEQRGLYWIWMEDIAKTLDLSSKDAAHESFKKMFLKGKSSMKLNKVQYSAYMDFIYQWCESHDIVLTPPNYDRQENNSASSSEDSH